jgi:hypothetical protein
MIENIGIWGGNFKIVDKYIDEFSLSSVDTEPAGASGMMP